MKVYCAFVDLANAASGVQISPVTDKFSLLDITPNPAHDRCTLTYELREPSSLTLDLIDATGNVLHTETFGTQAIGPHSLTLNLDGIVSGAYFVRVRTSFGYAVRIVEVKR